MIRSMMASAKVGFVKYAYHSFTGSWLETGLHYLFAKGILKIIPDDTPKVSEQLPESVYEELRIYQVGPDI